LLQHRTGKRDQLVGKIQERYGIAGDEAERQVAEFERTHEKVYRIFCPKTEVRRRGLPQTKMVFEQPSALVYVPGRHRQSSGSRRAVMLLCRVWTVGFVFRFFDAGGRLSTNLSIMRKSA